MSPGLAVFDFDQTVVAEDSDSVVMRMLGDCPQIPDDCDWIKYMQKVFSLVHAAGWTKEDVLSRIGSITPVDGIERLIQTLSDAGWKICLLTDANSVFVQHWLKAHELLDRVDSIITNPARWTPNGLELAPYTHQTTCDSCPGNLCKGSVLLGMREGDRVMYVGDGSNDVCPIATLRSEDVACPRIDFPCHRALSRMAPIPARVVPWRDHYDILRELPQFL